MKKRQFTPGPRYIKYLHFVDYGFYVTKIICKTFSKNHS